MEGQGTRRVRKSEYDLSFIRENTVEKYFCQGYEI